MAQAGESNMKYNGKDSDEYRTGVLITKRFVSPTREERRSIRSCYNTAQGFFGATLDHEVPIPVCDCIAFIRNRGYYQEGVFRVPGNVEVVNLLKAQYNKVYESHEDKTTKMVSILNNHNPAPSINSVASLLKAYFTELTEPLIPKDVAVAMIKIMQLNLLPTLRMKMLDRLLHDLKSPNRECLGFLISFLREITVFVNFNQMDAENLSTCFILSIFGKGDAQFQLLVVKYAKSIVVDLIKGKFRLYMPSKSKVIQNTKYQNAMDDDNDDEIKPSSSRRVVEDKRHTKLSESYPVASKSIKEKDKKKSVCRYKKRSPNLPTVPPKISRPNVDSEKKNV